GLFQVPQAKNEVVKSYAPGTAERRELQAAIAEARAEERDIPMFIGGKEIRTGKKERLAPPHDHAHTLGHYHVGTSAHVKEAIDAALAARASWVKMAWEQRAAIFLKAADLIAGPYRAR